MNSLTDELNWHVKIFDDEIVAKWRKAALGMPLINEKAWDWCLTELRDKAKDFESTGQTLVLDTATRCMERHRSCHEVAMSLSKTLIRTKMLRSHLEFLTGTEPCGPIAFSGYRAKFASTRPPRKMCILPPTSTIYIPGILNSTRRLRKSFLSIEPWNDVLIRHHRPRNPPRIETYAGEFETDLPDWADYGLREAEGEKNEKPEAYEEALKKVQEYLALPNAEDYGMSMGSVELLEEYGLSWAVEKKWGRMRNTIHPDAGVGYTYDQWENGQVSNAVVNPNLSYSIDQPPDPRRVSHHHYDVNLRKDFGERGLQVIVKLSSIELTPEKPTYGGGNWHIEGMLNEHIVATAIYYYDVDNVTESRISFRTETELEYEDLIYDQDDHAPLAEIFDVESRELRDEPAVQTLGSVSTPQGQLLAFPNTLQHEVEPFELVDKTKPGHRRFLVLWLVDPYYRIASTRNVPPQQHDWWAPEGYDNIDFSAFPPEILTMVTDQVGEWPMGLETAKELRSERTRGQQAINEGFQEYNFCEH
ncbi:hypothetical protein AB5N19_03161 [Seiridium cardinale]